MGRGPLGFVVDDVNGLAGVGVAGDVVLLCKGVDGLDVVVLEPGDLYRRGGAEKRGVLEKGAVRGRFGVSRVATGGAGAGLAGFEHDDVSGPSLPGLDVFKEVPCYRCAGDAASDDDDVGTVWKVFGGTFVSNVGGRILPVALSWILSGGSDSDLGAFVHCGMLSSRYGNWC